MAKNSKKQMSGMWIPPTSEITLQKQPLWVYFMNITSMISEFRIMLRNFVGKGKFGKSKNGQCLWDTEVEVDSLSFSKKSLGQI